MNKLQQLVLDELLAQTEARRSQEAVYMRYLAEARCLGLQPSKLGFQFWLFLRQLADKSNDSPKTT